MTPSLEEDLLRELDRHDALVARCARGDLSWQEFETAYDSFFPRYPLDGHEGSAELMMLLRRHAGRITLHRQVWEQVLTRVTSADHAGDPGARDAGFIGPQAAVRRLQDLVQTHLGV
jgi:hypothetical protein